MSAKNLIAVVGPTAIGKTDLAIKLAQHFQTEIISADSRQFYREMSIGTAKPSVAELSAAKHHFINSHSVTEDYTVGDFEQDALVLLTGLFQKHDFVVLAGGSGLFVKAVTEGFDDLPKAAPGLRDELNGRLLREGLKPLQEQLKSLDPVYYAEVDTNNPQRIIRALEVCLTTGKPFSSFRRQQSRQRDFNVIKIGLNADRPLLYERINSRVDNMIGEGLVNEVKSLLPFRNRNALNTVGYSEIFSYFDNKISLAEAIEQIKQNTRRFAKRQLTWFRRDEEIEWFKPEAVAEIIAYIEKKAKLSS